MTSVFLPLALVCAGPLSGWPASASHQAVSDEGIVTIDNVYDCVLPLGLEPEQEVDWRLTLRILPTSESEPEWFAAVTRGASRGQVMARVIVPDGFRIFSRYRELEKTADHLTCGQLRARAPLRVSTFSDRDVRALRTLATQLERQQWPAVPDLRLMFHATGYEAEIATERELTRISIQGPTDRSGKIGARWHPLVRWAEDLRRALKADSK